MPTPPYAGTRFPGRSSCSALGGPPGHSRCAVEGVTPARCSASWWTPYCRGRPPPHRPPPRLPRVARMLVGDGLQHFRRAAELAVPPGVVSLVASDREAADRAQCGRRWEHAAPVGQLSANPFGLYDMIGNVPEWVQDCWRQSYDGMPSDGAPRTTDRDLSIRGIRGRSAASDWPKSRTAKRGAGSTETRGAGFGVARTISDPHELLLASVAGAAPRRCRMSVFRRNPPVREVDAPRVLERRPACVGDAPLCFLPLQCSYFVLPSQAP